MSKMYLKRAEHDIGNEIAIENLFAYVSAYFSCTERVDSLVADIEAALKKADETTETQIVDQDGEYCFHVTPAGFIILMVPWKMYRVIT